MRCAYGAALTLRPVALVAAATALLLASAASGAVADRLITGADVKDGSLQAKDLFAIAQRKLAGQGLAGPQGPAGPAAQSISIDSTEVDAQKSLTLPDGTAVNASCHIGGSAHGYGRDATLTIDSSRYTFVDGRVDVGQDGNAVVRDAGYAAGEHYVAASGTGSTLLGVDSSSTDTTEPLKVSAASFDLLVHYGATTIAVDVALYVDSNRCQIQAHFVPSHDS